MEPYLHAFDVEDLPAIIATGIAAAALLAWFWIRKRKGKPPVQ